MSSELLPLPCPVRKRAGNKEQCVIIAARSVRIAQALAEDSARNRRGYIRAKSGLLTELEETLVGAHELCLA